LRRSSPFYNGQSTEALSGDINDMHLAILPERLPIEVAARAVTRPAAAQYSRK